MTRPRNRWLVVAAVVTAVLTGCAAIPTSGPVQQRGEARTDRDDPFVRMLAKGPVEGMTAEQVLRGFLRASAAFDDSHAVARQFLTPDAATGWDVGAGAVVYAEIADRPLVARSGNVLRLDGREVATLSARGEYTAADAESNVGARFVMRKSAGEWRIDQLPDGLFLTPLDVDRSYRSFNLYFLDPSMSRLVPNAVLLPVGPLASTTLVQALLDGPTEWLGPAVRSAFPAGTELTVPSAPVQEGVVQVDLARTVLTTSPADREALSAQLVWTLRQLPDVSAVRISADGVPLPGVGGEQRRDAWPEYSPDGPPVGDPYFARKGRLLQLGASEPIRVPGALGNLDVAAADPARAPLGDQLAALSPDGTTLYLTDATESAPVRTPLLAAGLTPPSWDPLGFVWTAARTERGSRVYAVRPGATSPRQVSAPELADKRVGALRVAHDGVRVALVLTGPRAAKGLYVARIERSGDSLTLGGLRRVESALVDVTDVAWADADRLAVIGQEPNGVLQPLIIEADGAVTRSAGSLSGVVRLAAAPGRPLLAATKDGVVWIDTDLGWQRVGDGSDPAYPG